MRLTQGTCARAGGAAFPSLSPGWDGRGLVWAWVAAHLYADAVAKVDTISSDRHARVDCFCAAMDTISANFTLRPESPGTHTKEPPPFWGARNWAAPKFLHHPPTVTTWCSSC